MVRVPQVPSLVIAAAVMALVLCPRAVLAQSDDMTGCKNSIMGALAGATPMPAPMPMPMLKPDEPMPTGMAPPSAKQGDVGKMAAVQDKCMDQVLSGEQSEMDKKK